jgi:hypothetical protein
LFEFFEKVSAMMTAADMAHSIQTQIASQTLTPPRRIPFAVVALASAATAVALLARLAA